MKNVAKAYSNMYMYIEKEKNNIEKDLIWNRKWNELENENNCLK